MTHLYGADLSGWNIITDIKEAAKHMDFVYLKATEGKTNVSKDFAKRREQFKDLGVPVGAYHFGYFKKGKVKEAIQQAKWFCKHVGLLGLDDLKPVLDVEDADPGWQTPHSSLIRAFIDQWIEVVENELGTQVMIYTYWGYFKSKIREWLWDRALWLAAGISLDKSGIYPSKAEPPKDKLIPGVEYTLLQYTSKAKIPGIRGRVDFNRVARADLSTIMVEEPCLG